MPLISVFLAWIIGSKLLCRCVDKPQKVYSNETEKAEKVTTDLLTKYTVKTVAQQSVIILI